MKEKKMQVTLNAQSLRILLSWRILSTCSVSGMVTSLGVQSPVFIGCIVLLPLFEKQRSWETEQ